tara:strand:+ start:133 stop:1464 length:1332 start_codon:yes stop_codon:yes gene_type:complete
MKITIVGAGYVGLVTGACFADAGHTVRCLDINQLKVDNLKKGILPIYEKRLQNLIQSNYAEKRLFFTTSYEQALKSAKIIFIAVDTPAKKNGQTDLKSIKNVCTEVAKYLKPGMIIVEKSTVPVGTSDLIKDTIKKNLIKTKKNIKFHVVSNPEFLKEGTAIDDFLKPDRIIIGIDDDSLKETFINLYRPFNRRYEKIHFMDIRSAELTKYAANAMLATKISFINELSNIAEKVNADIDVVRKGIGADKRIGYEFLYPGCGYGGSCLPKDIDALITTSLNNKYKAELLSSVVKVNERQKLIMFTKIKNFYKGKLKGKKIAVWGLAFKPNTDDTRYAPSIDTIKLLIKEGATITAYDPVASLKNILSTDKKKYQECVNALDAIKKSDALLIFTEWKEFWSIDISIFKKYMNHPVVFDGRNIYSPEIMKENKINYFSFGRNLSNQ